MEIRPTYAQNILTVLRSIANAHERCISYGAKEKATFIVLAKDIDKTKKLLRQDFIEVLFMMQEPHIANVLPYEILEIADTNERTFKGQVVGENRYENPSSWPIAEVRPKKGYRKILLDFKKQYGTDSLEDPTKISLLDTKVSYSEKTSALAIDKTIILVPPNTHQSEFCKRLFREDINFPIGWSEVAEYILGKRNDPSNLFEVKGQEWWTVYNAQRAVNDLVKEKVHTDDELFTFKNNVILRNY